MELPYMHHKTNKKELNKSMKVKLPAKKENNKLSLTRRRKVFRHLSWIVGLSMLTMTSVRYLVN
jgi:hypothetical protein